MRQRAISSVAVVLLTIVPLVVGGPVFALLMIVLGLLGYAEFLRLARHLGGPTLPGEVVGYAVVAALGIAALFTSRPVLAMSVIAVAIFAPLTAAVLRSPAPNAIAGTSFPTLGMLYLGLPIFAAITLRETAGPVSHDWLNDLADVAALSWPSAPRGLAWTALVICTIWVGDVAAYLVGRAFGRRRLAPRVSPKKTVEGSLAGLLGSALTSVLASAVLGLDLSVFGALALGLGLGVTGQLGDLIESLLKRQAGVKDSGAIIPGHGGILDRIDALLLTFPAAWAITSLVDGSLL
jgi:phosphatidate cytidylyltransferase